MDKYKETKHLNVMSLSRRDDQALNRHKHENKNKRVVAARGTADLGWVLQTLGR